MNPSHLALLLGIATAASGHGIMIEPRPYNLETPPLQQVAPLSAELPFPCQGRTGHAEQRTTLTAGTSQTVRFWTSAVHGGGSCQFSVTYDHPPPADPARWNTIYTIIGDCPARAAGNLPTVEQDGAGRENGPQCGNDSGSECVRQFDVPIPRGIRNSDNATFAFTWFNKLGNREMYMTCAPVSIVGGAGDEDLMRSLPAVFTANIPGACTTGESGQVLNIPNPGRFGRVNAEPSAAGSGQCPAAGPPSFEDEESPQQGGGGAGDTATATAGSPSAAPTGAPQSSPSSFVTVTTPAGPAGAATSSGAAPAAAETSQPPWASGMTKCPAADGSIHCYEDNTFGLCNKGWADPMPLNQDQVCSDGEITYRSGSVAQSTSR